MGEVGRGKRIKMAPARDGRHRSNICLSKRRNPAIQIAICLIRNFGFLGFQALTFTGPPQKETPGMAGSAYRGPRPDLLTPRFRPDIWGTQFREILFARGFSGSCRLPFWPLAPLRRGFSFAC